MPESSGQQKVNPLLFAFFCPHCVLSGIFALAAGGLITLPSLFGLPPEHYLAPAIILGSFLGWLAWGAWQKRCTGKGAEASACSLPSGPKALGRANP